MAEPAETVAESRFVLQGHMDEALVRRLYDVAAELGLRSVHYAAKAADALTTSDEEQQAQGLSYRPAESLPGARVEKSDFSAFADEIGVNRSVSAVYWSKMAEACAEISHPVANRRDDKTPPFPQFDHVPGAPQTLYSGGKPYKKLFYDGSGAQGLNLRTLHTYLVWALPQLAKIGSGSSKDLEAAYGGFFPVKAQGVLFLTRLVESYLPEATGITSLLPLQLQAKLREEQNDITFPDIEGGTLDLNSPWLDQGKLTRKSLIRFVTAHANEFGEANPSSSVNHFWGYLCQGIPEAFPERAGYYRSETQEADPYKMLAKLVEAQASNTINGLGLSAKTLYKLSRLFEDLLVEPEA